MQTQLAPMSPAGDFVPQHAHRLHGRAVSAALVAASLQLQHFSTGNVVQPFQAFASKGRGRRRSRRKRLSLGAHTNPQLVEQLLNLLLLLVLRRTLVTPARLAAALPAADGEDVAGDHRLLLDRVHVVHRPRRHQQRLPGLEEEKSRRLHRDDRLPVDVECRLVHLRLTDAVAQRVGVRPAGDEHLAREHAHPRVAAAVVAVRRRVGVRVRQLQLDLECRVLVREAAEPVGLGQPAGRGDRRGEASDVRHGDVKQFLPLDILAWYWLSRRGRRLHAAHVFVVGGKFAPRFQSVTSGDPLVGQLAS
mmetsp:Transcript_19317/g.37586  ORF Transcript_19317/g.37586 Transcript_19317/m.37586 type:complete len:305 (-) Transcript_19317:2012-2926(-)